MLEVEGIKSKFEQRAIAWSYFKNENDLTPAQFLSGYVMAEAMQASRLPRVPPAIFGAEIQCRRQRGCTPQISPESVAES